MVEPRTLPPMIQADVAGGVVTPPQDGGGALRSKPLPASGSPAVPATMTVPATLPPQALPTLPPQSAPMPPPQPGPGGGMPTGPVGTQATKEGGTVNVKMLVESKSETPSMQSTAAPSSSQATSKAASAVTLPAAALHGVPGQVKPPTIPRGSQDPTQRASGGSGEVFVAHVPLHPQGTPPSGSPVHLSPLLQPRDRLSGIASPGSQQASITLQRQAPAPQQPSDRP